MPLGPREPVNAFTHLAGAVLAALGTVFLLGQSRGDPLGLVSFGIYGVTLVGLFTASTLLHAARAGERTLRRLRILDHAAIFLLIAGSYTPVTLLAMRQSYPTWSLILLAFVWVLAVLGVVFKLFWISAPRRVSTAIYLLMGWIAVLGIVPLVETLTGAGLMWLVLGGLFYSVGAVVYALRKPDPLPGVMGYHEIWHLFVLAGAGSHYLLMLQLL